MRLNRVIHLRMPTGVSTLVQPPIGLEPMRWLLAKFIPLIRADASFRATRVCSRVSELTVSQEGALCEGTSVTERKALGMLDA